MYKKILAASLVAAAVLFSGCGNEDTTCRIGVQQAIDQGRYNDAIADLQGQCATAFTRSDLNMNLAAAYMGKSGYSVSDIADMLINSDNNGSDAFASFISSVDKKKNPDSLPLLTKANNYFLYAIGQNPNSDASTFCTIENINNSNDSRLTNACLYIGFNQTITAANTITYLTGNIDGLVESINDSNSTPYDMRASLDALVWATTSSYTPKSDTNITALDVNITNVPFTHIAVEYDDNGSKETFYRLAKSSVRDANNTTVITDGYCDSDGNRTACEGIENDDGSINTNLTAASSCYACPVMLDANSTLSVADLLVNTLNGGSDTIAAVSGDADITNSIADFKEAITGSRDGNVTIQNIIDYLQQ